MKRGTNLQKQSDTDFKGVAGIVSLFIFWIFLDIKMMFLILDISSFLSLCSRSLSRVTSNPVICDGLKIDLLCYSVVYQLSYLLYICILII